MFKAIRLKQEGSATCSSWQRIARLPPAEVTTDRATTVPLCEAIASAQALLAGQVAGRRVVDLR